jgi:CelD/BcsL family acetyltransferase involved in cellulose biosynthesis
VRTDIARIGSFEAVGRDWEALEAAGAGESVFQSWSWVGCLAAERYPDPVLLRAFAADGQLAGLALFNRRRGGLWLAESGDDRFDRIFIEHNAPLVRPGPDAAAARQALLRAAWRVPGVSRLVLSGVTAGDLAAAGGTPWRLQSRPAPFIDLAALREAGTQAEFLATLSANARYQIRRSHRRLATRGDGPLAIEAATTEAEALDWLEALIALHTARWRSLGQPGAFADAAIQRFHRTLVARLLARGQLDLLRVRAGEALVLGYLYNLRLRGHVHAYQSGFAAAAEGSQEKPGLSSHALAIERSLAAGDGVYDFLAGAQRYKTTLANATRALEWATLVPAWSPRGIAARLARRLGLRRSPAAPAADPAAPDAA